MSFITKVFSGNGSTMEGVRLRSMIGGRLEAKYDPENTSCVDVEGREETEQPSNFVIRRSIFNHAVLDY
jgi:hypothetical protein